MHLTAIERLAAHGTNLPAEFVKALGEDLEYARFGAALPELPWFGGIALGLDAFLTSKAKPRFAAMLVERAPVAFGLKAAELVSNGALVGTEAGLAFVAGYFVQVCVRRALEPVTQSLLATHARPGEDAQSARNRIEWAQSLLLMQDLHGSALVGTPAIRTKLQIRKASGPKGIGRGLYELMRVSSHDAFGDAPTKLEVDGWMRGLYLFGLALGSPLARLSAITGPHLAMKEMYRGPGVDVFASIDQGLAQASTVLTMLGSMIRRNSFSVRSRQKLLALLPEGAPADVIAPRAA